MKENNKGAKKMIASERYETILRLIQEQGIVKVKDLAKLMQVTETTIRRDCEELEHQGKLIRVHGGAKGINQNKIVSNRDEKNVRDRTEFSESKELVCKKAASFVKEGDCIFLDGITTVVPMVKYLKDKNLVDDCYANMQPFYGTTVEISENKISNTAMKMINDGALYTNVKNDGNIEVELNNIWILGNAYNEILKRAGVKELKENEVIISSGITEKTKYGNKVNFTNLKVGDSYTVDIGKTIGNSAASQKTFTIAGIVDDFTPYINSKFNKEIVINQIISPENAISLIKEYGYVSFAEINIKTDAERAMKIDESIKDIKEIYGENGAIIGNNNLPNDFSNKKDSVDPSKDLTRITTNKVSLANEFNILQILLYSFVVVVAIISSVNIFNSIYANIMLRKKDFASLKSIGMSNKQMNKMMFFEGIFYGLKAMIFGISISIGILYLSYLFMIQTEIYLFNISWKSIFASIIVMYIVIFVSIICAKNELKNKNIVDEIREENI